MKFLAILRDSLREAIDAKVFYVMIGLSLLLIGLASTTTFKPQPGGNFVMQVAAVPLVVDLSDLDLSEPDPDQLRREMTGGRFRGLFRVSKVEPVDGYGDTPNGLFRVLLEGRLNPLAPGGWNDPEAHIRKYFGAWDRWKVAEVVEVKRVTRDGGLANLFRDPLAAEFEVVARVTPEGRRLWPHDFSLFFGAAPLFKQGVPLNLQLYIIEDYIVNGIGAWVTILVSIIITAFFVPNMLRKGTIDMLLAKPISRSRLLLYKYVGGLLFILLNTAVAIIGVWLALSLRSGVWAPAFLLSILTITFYFAILYSVSTLFSILTRSPIVSIIMTCVFATLLFAVGALHAFFEGTRKQETRLRTHGLPRLVSALAGVGAAPGQGPLLTAGPLLVGTLHPPGQPPWIGPLLEERLFADNWFARSVAGVHFVLPRSHDLSDLTTLLLVRDLVFNNQIGTEKLKPVPISWGESLTVSGLFIALMLGLSCWRFATRDY